MLSIKTRQTLTVGNFWCERKHFVCFAIKIVVTCKVNYIEPVMSSESIFVFESELS